MTERDEVSGLGRLYGVGVGPGDPELMTIKAVNRISSASVVAYFAARGRSSNARTIAAGAIRSDHEELLFEYPVTTERLTSGDSYEQLMIRCYDESAALVEAHLRAGRDVAVLCEGDPLFYGSYMYLHNRLAGRFEATVVPGISSLTAGAAAIARPLACGDELLSVLSGVMTAEALKDALTACDAAVVIKIGRNLAKVRDAIESVGLIERAWYVERASHDVQVCCPLADADAAKAPYFSMIVVPSAVAGLR